MQPTPARVITVAAMPPEKCAYALARYSRSPDSIAQSIEWVRSHDSEKFLESYYFQYGHASIADLGHTVMCFEGISELAATEIEDEPLWDGQARSSRYQDFARSGLVVPPEFGPLEAEVYRKGAETLLCAYSEVHRRVADSLAARLPQPPGMSPDTYRRNLAARAFDVARYLLFLGVPTSAGQVTSIRTLEKQIRRMKASEYGELRDLAGEMARACARGPDCVWDAGSEPAAVAPTLARFVDADEHLSRSREDLRQWAAAYLPAPAALPVETVDLLQPADPLADIVATLLYPVCDRPYRELHEIAAGWSAARRREVIDTALGSRGRRDELLRAFRTAPFVYDIVMDIGAYRDLHRHRRCQQFRQPYTVRLGYDVPSAVIEAGAAEIYSGAMRQATDSVEHLPEPGAHYLIPFGSRSRFLFKMDFAEAEYISRLRSGVKGHFSYREIAWMMKVKMELICPELGRLIDATPPEIEDPLKR